MESSRRRNKKRVRLSQDEKDRLGLKVESAASRGYDELRVFWDDNGNVRTAPVRSGNRERL